MPKLTSKLGTWELDHVHMWRERAARIRAAKRPLVEPETRIATIGSCFAQELAGALGRMRLHGGMHPGGLYYNSRSIRQEVERMAGIDVPAVGPWEIAAGWIDPLKNYRAVHPSREALEAWSAELDAEADRLFRSADVVVVTLGLIEAWLDPKTGLALRQIPHPEVFDRLGATFHRQSVTEIESDLDRIYELVRGDAEIVLTVSPIPLHATMTPLDVRVANTESKSRIRAAVSQFLERHRDVGYFHSYEMVTTAEQPGDLLLEDGRHVRRRAVDLIVHEFLETFGTDELELPAIDTSWLTAPNRTAERPKRSTARRVAGMVSDILGGSR